jgi:hypothetical protein
VTLRALRRVFEGIVALAWLGVGAWASAAIWFRAGLPRPLLAGVVFAFMLAAAIGALAVIRRRGAMACGVSLGALVVFAIWYSSVKPSNDRDWTPDVARPPVAEIDGDRVTIRNIRNFDYRSETDFDERWEERSYDLSKIDGVDLFLSYWGSPSIAHTIVSWEFADSDPLAISIETRKEKGETYSSVRGFFREYELYYVIADERDLVGLRTNHRGEHVYLYRVRMSRDRARALLVDYLEEANRMADHPKWYNAFTHNCTTAIRKHVKHVSAGNPWNWRVLVNGYLDELMYERGTIDTSLPFAEMKAKSEITERAKAAEDDPAFSRKIREGIPLAPASAD